MGDNTPREKAKISKAQREIDNWFLIPVWTIFCQFVNVRIFSMDLSFNLDLLYMIKLFRPNIYTVLAFERAVTFFAFIRKYFKHSNTYKSQNS